MSTAIRHASSIKTMSHSIRKIRLLLRGWINDSKDSVSTKFKMHPVTKFCNRLATTNCYIKVNAQFTSSLQFYMTLRQYSCERSSDCGFDPGSLEFAPVLGRFGREVGRVMVIIWCICRRLDGASSLWIWIGWSFILIYVSWVICSHQGKWSKS